MRSKRMDCLKINFEEYVKKRFSGREIPKHVDYIYVCSEYVYLVEETRRAKIDDINKIHGILDLLREEIIEGKKIKAIIHSKRGFDPMVYRLMMNRKIAGANCNEDLKRKLV